MENDFSSVKCGMSELALTRSSHRSNPEAELIVYDAMSMRLFYSFFVSQLERLLETLSSPWPSFLGRPERFDTKTMNHILRSHDPSWEILRTTQAYSQSIMIFFDTHHRNLPGLSLVEVVCRRVPHVERVCGSRD